MHRYMRWSSKNEDKDTHTISTTGGLRLARVFKMCGKWELVALIEERRNICFYGKGLGV